MIASDFSFIIPVYNRPEEVRELLESFCELDSPKTFEIVIVEDGSSLDSRLIVENYQSQLNISYFFKDNSGPGHSRNYGMKKAKGHYYIILDSDCILPKQYLSEVISFLNESYVDCFGGPDTARYNFSEFQKAINFTMTSAITTGGIRGGNKEIKGFEPRSFNMGISKEAFNASGGFGDIHPGEDPDLSIRLKAIGYKLCLIPKAFVYHKRRLNIESFFIQVYKFGQVRPILNKWHPQSKKLAYWFPLFFVIGLIVSLCLLIINFKWGIYLYSLYFIVAFLMALNSTVDIIASILCIPVIIIQFLAYGMGFLKSSIKLKLSKKPEYLLFPKLFFKTP
tara:strand:- start:374 stop:1384 length:1011 start_codon:yes stop_codon:yes gene_type:complete